MRVKEEISGYSRMYFHHKLIEAAIRVRFLTRMAVKEQYSGMVARQTFWGITTQP
jgi:hypothetical protein